jgi:hypothetical protein
MKRLLATTALLLVLTARAADPDVAVLEPSGLGPIKLGMSVAQLASQLGEPINEPSDPKERSCWYVESSKHPDVQFMVKDGRLRRIDVQSTRVAALGAIRVGDSEQTVKRRFGTRVVQAPHHYGGPKDHYLTVRLNSSTAIRFETTDGKVDLFYLGGLEQVQLVEGCRWCALTCRSTRTPNYVRALRALLLVAGHLCVSHRQCHLSRHWCKKSSSLSQYLLGALLAISGGAVSQLLAHRWTRERDNEKTRRERAEALIKGLYAYREWVTQKASLMLFRHQDHDSPSPLDEVWMIQSIYFPELHDELLSVQQTGTECLNFIYTERSNQLGDLPNWAKSYDKTKFPALYKPFGTAVEATAKKVAASATKKGDG